MIDGEMFRRKLAKFRTSPDRFFADSRNPAVRAFGALVTEKWSRPRSKSRRKVMTGTPREIIEASGLFDATYYLAKYPDLRTRVADPLGHYLKHGVREARSPNVMFDPKYYAKHAGIQPFEQPLLHYITTGEAKGLRPSPDFDPAFYVDNHPDVGVSEMGALEHFLKVGQQEGRATHAVMQTVVGGLSLEHDLRAVSVTILIPVFNGGAHVRRCIESVLAHANMSRARLLIIDDASTDEFTRSMLTDYERFPCVELLRNERNLGFTRTVNRGIQHAGSSDIVLLNSDTVVGPRFLEQLAIVAYGASTIATATALSDNAGAFSTPEVPSNPTHLHLPVHDAARLSQRAALSDVHFVPTGNGFCMYMRRDAIEKTGLLDELNFPRGYGEENDWCMRASERGYRHVIALRSYVHHVNAVSFGASAKEQLREDARRTIDRIHPDYGIQVKRAFGGTSPLTTQRQRMRESLEEVDRRLATTPRPRVLFVVSTRSGGTPLTNEDLMRGVSHAYEPYLLTCDTRELQVLDYSEPKPRLLARHALREPVPFVPHTSAEYDTVVASWLARFAIELVHVRHIGWHSLGLIDVACRQQIPVVFSFHDFYAMCPSVNLTNGKDPWSEAGITSPHIVSPLWSRRDASSVEAVQSVDPHAFLAMWKRRMNAMLINCSAFVTTSPFVKDVLTKNLPVLKERTDDFHVIPHGRDFDEFRAAARAPHPRKPLRVLVAGNITEQKGLETILDVLRLDDTGAIEIHLLGTARDSLLQAPNVKNHGPYARENFIRLVGKISPHIGLIPTICPETFCHTLTECWAAGLPVVGSNIGAVGERIAASGAGWVVDPLKATEILALLRRIRSGEEDWSSRVRAITAWQQSTADWDVAAMSRQYLDVYRAVTRRNRSLLAPSGERMPGARTRVAVVIRGHYPHSLPTSHVRIATPLGQASGESVDYDWIDAAELVRTGVTDFDGVVVCRNAGEPELLSELARLCTSERVPLVFDLDDDLLNVPRDKDSSGGYAASAPALHELLSAASLVTMSTQNLVNTYQEHAREVRLVPNRLDPKVWLTPISESNRPPEWQTSARTHVLYMGSPTHREDLEMVLPAFERLSEQGVVLYVVGVTDRKHPPGVVSISPPHSRYDLFIRWFRSIAPHFDLAIAPLVDTRFNRAKSDLKFMEYAVCGLATVASRVEPYAQTVRHGVDGLLADNEPASWREELERLISDSSLRIRLGQAARKRAEEEFVCRSCAFDELPWREWRASFSEISGVRNVERALTSKLQAGA